MGTHSEGKSDWNTVRALLAGGTPVITVGPSGIGKTARAKYFARDFGWDFIVPPPLNLSRPEDFLGPLVVSGTRALRLGPGEEEEIEVPVARHSPPHWAWRALEAVQEGREVLVLLDEINRPRPEVAAALLPFLAAPNGVRQLGELSLPAEAVHIYGTANPNAGGFFVNDLDAALVGRVAIVHVGVDVAEWLLWATEAGIHPDIIGFIKEQPEWLLLEDEEAVAEAAAALRPYPNPRMWAETSKYVGHTKAEAACVGERAALAFDAWRATLQGLPTLEDLLAGARFPSAPARAVVTALRAVDAALEGGLATVVALLARAADWPPDVVIGVVLPRLKAAAEGGRLPHGWVGQVIAKAPGFVARHGRILAALQ